MLTEVLMVQSFRVFTSENLFAFAFFIILLTLLWLVVSFLSPFLPDFLWAFILAVSFYPLYSRINKQLINRPNLASFLLTSMVIVVLIVPSFFVLTKLGKETGKIYAIFTSTPPEQKTQWVMDKLQAVRLKRVLADWGLGPEKVKAIVKDNLTKVLNSIPKFILEKVSGIFKNLFVFFIHVLLGTVALFFFFRDGAHYAALFIQSLPLDQDHKIVISKTISHTVSAVVRGMFMTALLQGVLAGTGFAVAGLPVPILLGVLTMVNSFIPFLGAASVWFPAAVWLFLENETITAIGLALYGVLIISMVDNILRPLFIGEETKIPVFMLFFIILGGLKVYGFIGIFLGPIILALGMAFLSIYRDMYLEPMVHEEDGQ
jgi:predicted PurR-regulated permease PerM